MSARRGARADLPAVLAQWDEWLSTATDRLMSLDERVTAAHGGGELLGEGVVEFEGGAVPVVGDGVDLGAEQFGIQGG